MTSWPAKIFAGIRNFHSRLFPPEGRTDPLIPAKTMLRMLPAYTLAALALTWPLLPNFAQMVPGNNGDLQTGCLWPFRHVARAVADPNEPLFTSHMLLAPWGVDLLFHPNHIADAVLTLPIQMLSGVTAAYNTALLLNIILGSFCFAVFCRELRLYSYAAFLGGLAYGLSPYVFAHMPGHFNLLKIAWVPLMLTFWLRLLEPQHEEEEAKKQKLGWHLREFRWHVIVGLGFSVWGLFVSDVYLSAIGVLLAFLLTLGKLITRPGLFIRPNPWIEVTKAAGIAGLFAVPWIVAFLGAIRSHDYRNIFPWAGSESYSTLVQFITPAPFHPFWGHRFNPSTLWHPGAYSERGNYLGLVALLLGFVALGSKMTRRPALFWWIVLLIFANLSLANRFVDTKGYPDWLFLGKLWPSLPIINQVRVPSRFSFGATFAAAVLCALAMQAIRTRLPRIRLAAFAAAVILIVIDFAAWPVALTKCEPRPFYLRNKLSGSGTLLTFPLGVAGGANGAVGEVDSQQFIDQFAHEKPLISAYLARVPNEVMKRLRSDRVFLAIVAAQKGITSKAITPQQASDFCRFHRIDTVLLDPNYRNTATLIRLVQDKFPVVKQEEVDGHVIYHIDPTAVRAPTASDPTL